MWKHKRPWISKAKLSQKNNAGGITIPDFKLYYKAITIKTGTKKHKNRHEDQWNRIEDADVKPHNYNWLVFDKGAKNIRWRNSSLFNKNCWENWLAVCKKVKKIHVYHPIPRLTQNGSRILISDLKLSLGYNTEKRIHVFSRKKQSLSIKIKIYIVSSVVKSTNDIILTYDKYHMFFVWRKK
jgi:hypothetical protein